MKNKKSIAGLIAGMILITGTFAWQSFSQIVTNEILEQVDPAGARLHDYFNGQNKDVFVENYATGEFAPDVFARIRFSEYMEYGSGAGSLEADPKNIEIIRGDIQDVSLPILNDADTWDIYQHGKEVAEEVESIRTYRELGLGGQSIYLPTFNQDNTDLNPDVNGTMAGKDGDGKENSSSRYSDYVEYKEGEIVEGHITTENGQASIISQHIAKSTEEAEIIMMDDWWDKGGPIGDYWVFDTDGWAYYAKPIGPQETSGLILDNIIIESNPKEEWYYAVDVKAQFATAGDWGDGSDNENGTGMYEDGLSDDGLDLLNKVAGITKVTNFKLTRKDYTPLKDSDKYVSFDSYKDFSAYMEISNSSNRDSEEDVIWKVTERVVSGDGCGYDETKLNDLLNDGVFTPTEEMIGNYYQVTATSVLTPTMSDSFEMFIYDANGDIELYTKDNVVDIELGQDLMFYSYIANSNLELPANVRWDIEEISGSSGMSSNDLLEMLSPVSNMIGQASLSAIADMVGGVYRITAISGANDEYSKYIDVGVFSTEETDKIYIDIILDAAINIGDTIQPTVEVVGLLTQDVTWSILPQNVIHTLNNDLISDTIDSVTGIFTPVSGMGGNTYTITATSVLSDKIVGSSEIYINDGSVDVDSNAASMTLSSSAYTMNMSSSVSNITGSGVTWTITEQGTSTGASLTGAISSSGEFTATDAMTGGIFRITATSTVDTSKSGYKDISITAGTITLSGSTTVNIGSSVIVGGSISNLRASDITWSVTKKSGNSSITPTITADGIFTPVSGMASGVYTVTGKATSNSKIIATRDITVNNGSVTVSSSAASMTLSSSAYTMSMSSSVSNITGNGVTWSIVEQGTSTGASLTAAISSSGVFTATDEMAGGTFRITATSTVDTSKSGYKDISITAGTITLSGNTTVNIGSSITVGGSISNLRASDITWSVAKKSGNSSTTPTISTSGTFTPVSGMASGVYTVTGKATSNNKVIATRDITVNNGSVTVSSSATSMTLSSSAYTMSMSSSVSNITGSGVTWSITEQGTSTGASLTGAISSSGVFTATDAMTGGTFRITATSTVDTAKSGYKDITIAKPTLTLTSDKSSMTLSSSSYTATLTPKVTGARDTGVTYTVVESSGSSGYNTTSLNSTVSGNTFTAADMMTGGSYKITAKCNANTSVTKDVTISISTATISLARAASTVDQGETVKFTQTVAGLRSSGVTWSRSGNSSTSTTVSSGTLTVAAAETVGNTITVKATSSSKTSISGSNTVTITSAELIPGIGSVAAGSSTTVTANGSEFYVLEKTTLNGKTLVKLLLKENTGTSVVFDTSGSSTYSGSTVESAVNSWYTSWLTKGAISGSDVLTGSDLVSKSSGSPTLTSTTKAFLLSYTEANALSSSMHNSYSYGWLRTKATSIGSYNNAYSQASVGTIFSGSTLAENRIRPCIWVYV